MAKDRKASLADAISNEDDSGDHLDALRSDLNELRGKAAPVPEEKAKYRVATTRVGMKRVTTMIEPDTHRWLKVQAATDGISIEECLKIGLRMFLDARSPGDLQAKLSRPNGGSQ